MVLRLPRTLSLTDTFDALNDRSIKHAINLDSKEAQIRTRLKWQRTHAGLPIGCAGCSSRGEFRAPRLLGLPCAKGGPAAEALFR